MKVRNVNLKLRVLSLAMVGVVSSMYAYADEEEAAALMNPTSSVEVEVINVSTGSQKFGEYNGLNKQGGYVNGNINIRGGDAYKDNQNGGTNRWTIQGTDLGLSDRSANVGFSDQGNWGVGVGYDELTHNLAPGYQTPYKGSVGGNNFTLPSSFTGTAVNTGLASQTGMVANTQYLGSSQLNQFQSLDISSTRKNTSFNATKVINQNLNIAVEFNHLDQSGAKLMGFASSQFVGTSTSAEKTSILPNPTNYQTDTISLALNWLGEKGRLTGSYFGSFFRDGFNGVNWTTFAGSNTTQTMATAPSNQLQQLNLSGGYDFSGKTKLAGNLSIGRNTQNSSTAYDPSQVVGTPGAFNGLTNTSHFDLKLTDGSVKDLHLAAMYKFDQNNNLSQSQMQNYYPLSLSSGIQAPYTPNTPLSFRNSLIELGSDYRLTKDQKASLTYSNLQTARWCNQYATGTSPTGGTGVYANYTYPQGADCVTANFNRSNIVNAGYKIKASDEVDIKLNYIYDIRKTTFNQSALTAMPVTTTSGVNVNNLLPVSANLFPGQNGGDYVGYVPFFEASRNQQVAKGRVNWQPIDILGLGLTGKYTYAAYPDSTYGIQNSTAWNVGLDASLQYAEEGSITAYAVQQNTQRNLSSYYYGSSTNYGIWGNNLTGHDTTLGLGIKHGGLMSGKLKLNSDLTYSLGQSFYNTTQGAGYVLTNTTSLSSASFGSPPAIRNDLFGIRLGGTYQLDKNSKVGLQYLYQRLVSNDYYFNGLQYGYSPQSVMPTNQTPGGFNVNVFTVGYTYSFD